MWTSAEVLGQVQIRVGCSVEGRLPGSTPIHWKVDTGTPCNGATKFVPICNQDFYLLFSDDTCEEEGLQKNFKWQESLFGELDDNCADY